MKNTKLMLVTTVLLVGTLSACKPEPVAPAAEVAPPAAEPVVTPAPEPVVPAPVVPEAATTPAATDATPAAGEEEEDDTPHSGGDKVGVGH